MRKIKGSPQPFGVDIKGKNINFAVQVAKGKTCELLLYKRGKEVPEYQFDMPEEEGVGEVRFLSVEGLKADRYEYNFLIDGKVCVDPYVKELAGKEKFGVERKLQEHQIRGKIVSMGDYDWQPRMEHRSLLPNLVYVQQMVMEVMTRKMRIGGSRCWTN